MKSPKFLFFPAIITILLSVTGCNIYYSIYTDYDRTVDFTKYKSFAWLPDMDTTKTIYNNDIIRSNTRNYFAYEFAERGFRIDVDSPDVLLELKVTNALKGEYMDVPYTVPSWYLCNPYYQSCPPIYYYRYPYSYNYNIIYVTEYREYVEGCITLNVIDRKQNKLVWTGSAKGSLYNPDYAEDNLYPAVYQMLNKFPVKPHKPAKP